MAVDSATALYLKAPALFQKATAGSAGTWADRAVDTEIISPFATSAGGSAEAARQIAVLEGPLCEDSVVIPGRRKDLIGKVITIDGDALDYGAGKPVFVIGFQEADATTVLSVIRELRGVSVLAIIKPVAISALNSNLTDYARIATPDPKEVAYLVGSPDFIQIDIDLGSVQAVSAIYLGALSTALDFLVTGGAAGYATDSVANLVVAPKLRAVAPRRNILMFAEKNWRYIRLYSTATTTAGFEVGNLVVGDAFRPTWGHEYGGGRGVGDTGIATRLISGGFGILQGARFKTWDFALGDLTDAEVEELFDLAYQVGETNPVVICEDPDVTSNLDARIHYGKFAKIDRYERLSPGATRWNLKVEEWV